MVCADGPATLAAHRAEEPRPQRIPSLAARPGSAFLRRLIAPCLPKNDGGSSSISVGCDPGTHAVARIRSPILAGCVPEESSRNEERKQREILRTTPGTPGLLCVVAGHHIVFLRMFGR